MWLRNLVKQKPGQPIQARTLRTVAEAAEWATRIRVAPPLTMLATPFGPVIGLGGLSLQSGQLALTSGTITARSGTTAGTGTAYTVTDKAGVLTVNNGSGGAPTITLTVYSLSSTTAGIPTNTYVWIALSPSGAWWITTVDCGN